MSIKDELVNRAGEYARRHDLVLGDRLGTGVHGSVFVAESKPQGGVAPGRSAIKVHEQARCYGIERDVYLRLKAESVRLIHECEVPQLLRHDDELLILEMTVVTKPYLLDFAGVQLDRAPDFPEEVLADWHAEKREQFGGRWAEVLAILRVLEGYGIYLIDVNPNNISLPEK